MSKLILTESEDGKLFWLPENYEELGVAVTSGIPETLGVLSNEQMAVVQSEVFEKLKQVALISNALPNINMVHNVYKFNFTRAINSSK